MGIKLGIIKKSLIIPIKIFHQNEKMAVIHTLAKAVAIIVGQKI